MIGAARRLKPAHARQLSRRPRRAEHDAGSAGTTSPAYRRLRAVAIGARGGQPTWLSTEGSGVPWLHVRLDSYPKYYHTDAYRSYEQPPHLADHRAP